MRKAIHIFATEATPPQRRLGASGTLVSLGAVLAAGAWPLGWLGAGAALAVFAGVAAAVLRGLEGAPARDFGAANRVTAARAAVAALLLGVAVAAAADAVPLGADLRWMLAGLAAGAFLSDALDGHLARRGGMASRFGARFDMETDALFMLALALLVHGTGQAGAFVLLSGALRYLFVATGAVVPALRAPLRPSFRRKTVCAVQTGALVASLPPAVPASLAQWFCAAGLALLVFSFGVDAARLLLARPARCRQGD